MRQVDHFILYDTVQYTKNDWRNRNKIKTPQGLKWLTVPVAYRFSEKPRICDIEIADQNWAATHWEAIESSYSDQLGYQDFGETLKSIYLGKLPTHLSELNRILIEQICEWLAITTEITSSLDYQLSGDRIGRLVELCKQVGADRYLTGPSAKGYLDESIFERAGIEIRYMNYDNYPIYPQTHGDFEHHVSILDLLLCMGSEARHYLSAPH